MFNLDVEAANADDLMNTRIDKSGIYTGTITRAEWSKSQTSKAEAFDLDFVSDEGLESKYMRIWFKKKDGTNSFGYNVMNRIMACCSLRTLNKVPMGEKITCPELTNARITFALQAEAGWYEVKNTGEQKPTVNMIISTPFKADSGQSAKEVLGQLPAEQIKTLVVSDRKPRDKPISSMQAPAPQMAPAHQQAAPQMAPAYQQTPTPQGYNGDPTAQGQFASAGQDDLSDIPF